MQIKGIIVTANGEIIDHKLHSPFAYLIVLARGSKASKSSVGWFGTVPIGGTCSKFHKDAQN
jgi:hypothetical protein